MNATVNTAPAVRTRLEKLQSIRTTKFTQYEKLVGDISAIDAEIAAIAALAAVGEGSIVIVTIGKGEAARKETGTVIGVKVAEDGAKTFKVQYGTGFDTDVIVTSKVELPAVVDVEPGAQDPAAEVPTDEQPTE